MMKPDITIGDKYGPAMEITEQAVADEYFMRCVAHTMVTTGRTREQAEVIERENLGYFAGYYDHDTRLRVEQLFSCVHPCFGAAKDGAPAFWDAFLLGVRLAQGKPLHQPKGST